MKFSLNGAQRYSNVDLKNLSHAEIVEKIGLQLGAVEEIIDWKEKYNSIVVAKIVEFVKHPNADKLTVCRIDDGGVVQNINRDDEGYVQVVCGAPNVKGGLYVVWIPPGAIVPSTLNNDPFTLETREIRGKISNGMLASPRELGISDEHEGILILDEKEIGEKPIIGASVTRYFGLDDLIVDCENKMFTHRPDCFGNIGIAREVAGVFGLKYLSPEWYRESPSFVEAGNIEIDTENEVRDLVPRFMVIAMDKVSNITSPVWMQSYLLRVGIKPINSIVDITNYVMHTTGQPLHAFDLEKLKARSSNGQSIVIKPRLARDGEQLKLLGNKTIKLNESDLVIATDKEPVALAGIMGGADTEVDENTKSIVIECANFDMYTVRRSSMNHGLFTEAVTRFNKGQSPLQNDRVLAYAMQLLSEITGATQVSKVYDIAGFDLSGDNLNHLEVTAEFINSRLGSNLSAEEIKLLLENVEFEVSQQGQMLQITVPFWRMDIAIAEDIVEEVGRLFGYNNLPTKLPLQVSEPTKKNKLREFKNSIRQNLAKLGANEVLTYSFVHGDLLRACSIEPDKWAYHIRNALSPDLQYYRPALMPSLLTKIHGNIKMQSGSNDNVFAIFEIGKAHIKDVLDNNDHNLPKQMQHLAFVLAADEKSAKKFNGSAYYHVKKYLDQITNNQLSYTDLKDTSNPFSSAYVKGRSAVVTINGVEIGVIGEFNSKAKNKLKLPCYCAGFEIDLEMLEKNITTSQYKQISIYPSSKQDVTYETDESINWSDVENLLSAELAVVSAEENLDYELTPISIFKAEGSDTKRISFRVELSHRQKTLKTNEVSKIINQVSGVLGEKLGVKTI